MANGVVLTEEEIDYILEVPKPAWDSEWRGSLLPPVTSPYDTRGRYDLDDLPETGPVRGHLHLYTRRNIRADVEGDWSAGLVYTDYADRSFRILRCNGPHPTDHPNVIEGTTIVRTAHVHRMTLRYQVLRRPKPDGFAEPTDAYDSLDGAVEHLASLINLTSGDRLFL